MNKGCFVKTKDAETAKNLEEAGLRLLSCDGTTWTFINNSNFKGDFEKGKILYTDKLTF